MIEAQGIAQQKERIKHQLLNLINEDRLYHALLLTGDNKETFEFAKFISKALLCKDSTQKPCNKCSACLKADSDNHPDITVVSGSKGRKSFHVDDVRFLCEDAYIVPNESLYKVYILKNVEDMTVSASNAILKLIEEPPNGVVFILTCDSSTSLLPTVVSRCVCFDLGDSTEKKDDGKAGVLATEFLEALLNSYQSFFLETAVLFKEKDRQLIVDIVDFMVVFLDKAICIKAGSPIPSQSLEKSFAEHFTYTVLYSLQQALLQFKNKFLMNANKNILLTQFCIEIENALNIDRNV